MRTQRKLFAWIIAFILTLSIMPTSALANEPEQNAHDGHTSAVINGETAACTKTNSQNSIVVHLCEHNFSKDVLAYLIANYIPSGNGGKIWPALGADGAVTEENHETYYFYKNSLETATIALDFATFLSDEENTFNYKGIELFKNTTVTAQNIKCDSLTMSGLKVGTLRFRNASIENLTLANNELEAISVENSAHIQNLVLQGTVGTAEKPCVMSLYNLYDKPALESVDASAGTNIGTLNLSGSECLKELKLPQDSSSLTSLLIGPDQLSGYEFDLSKYTSLTTLSLLGTQAVITGYPTEAELTTYCPQGSGAGLSSTRISTTDSYGSGEAGDAFKLDADGKAALSNQYVRMQMDGSYTGSNAPRTHYVLQAVEGSSVDAWGIYYNGDSETTLSGYTNSKEAVSTAVVPANALVLASEDQTTVMIVTNAEVKENEAGEPVITIAAGGSLSEIAREDTESNTKQETVTFTGDATVMDDGSYSTSHSVTIKETEVNEDGEVADSETTTTINPNGGQLTVTATGSMTLPAGTTITTSEGTKTLPNGGTIGADGEIQENPAPVTPPSVPDSSSSSSSRSGYTVSVPSSSSIKHGSITVSPRTADKGDTVTVTVKPDDGYELDELTVTDKNGKTVKVTEGKNGKFTFTMPATKVTVEATFVKIEEAQTFIDVPDGYWAEDAIAWAAENGYMNGNSAVTFNPEGTVTRQQLWMILARLSGYQPADFTEAKAWAVDNGISDGTIPGNAVSRQQLVTILYRYAVRMGYNTAAKADLTIFPDHASVAPYAADAMAWSVANNIVGGTTQGTLNPAGTATRAQFAAILMRFYGNIME